MHSIELNLLLKIMKVELYEDRSHNQSLIMAPDED